RRHVEPDDFLAVDPADLPAVVGNESHVDSTGRPLDAHPSQRSIPRRRPAGTSALRRGSLAPIASAKVWYSSNEASCEPNDWTSMTASAAPNRRASMSADAVRCTS